MTRRQFLKRMGASLLTVGYSQLFHIRPTSGGIGDRNITVLVYHRVGYTRGALTVTPERFRNDLEDLADGGYQTIGLEQMRNFLLDKDVDLPPKPLLISFDDGYLDNYENAFPILKQYAMQAAFFVITGMMGDPGRLTRDCVAEMSAAGMSIGSHTITHRALAELSEEDMRTELVGSKSLLEEITHRPVQFLAYPRGSYNNTVVESCRQAGYIGGFTVVNGINTKFSEPFSLRRVPVFAYDRDVLFVIAKRT